MKSQKGITLASLAIYIILIFIVLGILTTVTLNFQSNIKEITSDGVEITEINRFNMYFLQEVKKQGNEVKQINDKEITFSTGAKYVFDTNNGVINLIESNDIGNVDKTIKLAENIEECTFSKEFIQGKNIITVNIKVKNIDTITKEYVLNSEQISSNYEDENEYIYNGSQTNEVETTE